MIPARSLLRTGLYRRSSRAAGSRPARTACTPPDSARKLPRATASDRRGRAADSRTIWRPEPRAISPTVSCGRLAPASTCPGHQSSLLPLTRDTTPSTAARMYGQLTFEYWVYTMAIIPAMALPMEILVYKPSPSWLAALLTSSLLGQRASWRQASQPCPSWGSSVARSLWSTPPPWPGPAQDRP